MKTAHFLKKPFVITVCADGFISVVSDFKKRRLKAGLPVYGCDDIRRALHLISKVCVFSCCEHGGKTGTTVEAKFVAWPHGGVADQDADYWLDLVSEAFEREDNGDNDRIERDGERCSVEAR